MEEEGEAEGEGDREEWAGEERSGGGDWWLISSETAIAERRLLVARGNW